MELSENTLYTGNSLLNKHAVYLKGKSGSIYVHYWGGETSLKTNTPHKHSFFEVCYVVKGEGIYIEKGKQFLLTSGTLFLSRPHVKHQIISKNDLFLLFVAFEPIYSESNNQCIELFNQLSNIEPIIYRLNKDNSIESMWKSLIQNAQFTHSFLEDTIISLSLSLIFLISQTFVTGNNQKAKKTNLNISSTLVYQAKLYIRDNLNQQLRLNDVANNLHISSRHLSRLFSKELGITFSQYVRNERINQATVLLITTNLPIKIIAQKTGFETVHYFSTVFKELMGVTPGKFIKRVRQNE